MFGEESIVKVVVTESKNGEYWSATENDGEYLYVGRDIQQTKKCANNKKELRIVSVDIERWNK